MVYATPAATVPVKLKVIAPEPPFEKEPALVMEVPAPPIVTVGVPLVMDSAPPKALPAPAVSGTEAKARFEVVVMVRAPETVSVPEVVRVTVVAAPTLRDGNVTPELPVASVTAADPVAKLALVYVPVRVKVPAPKMKVLPAVPVKVPEEVPPPLSRSVVVDEPRLTVPDDRVLTPVTVNVPVRVVESVGVNVLSTVSVLRAPKLIPLVPLSLSE